VIDDFAPIHLDAEAQPAESGWSGGEHALLPSTTLPDDWLRLLRATDLRGEISVSRFDGSPRQPLDVIARGPAMFCIGIFVKGRACMSLDGGAPLQIGAGMAVVQTAAAEVAGRFSMPGGEPVRLVDIRFSPEGFLRAGGTPLLALHGQFLQDRSLSATRSLLGGFPASPALLRVAGDILACDFDHSPAGALYLRAKALEALALVLRLMGPAPLRIGGRERQQLLQARERLEQRYDEHWTLERLAREVGLSEKKLQAGFRAMAGRTVHVHLLEVRLDAAASLLADGASVTDAAYATGFSSLSHFSKAFRAAKGVSPRHWRG
jgi:AraC-like DNA-binding protein